MLWGLLHALSSLSRVARKCWICMRFGRAYNREMALVLVVDDDPDVRDSVTDALQAEGYDVTQAEDGERALEQIARRPPDVILLDLRMPRWSGRDFLEALAHVPVMR